MLVKIAYGFGYGEHTTDLDFPDDTTDAEIERDVETALVGMGARRMNFFRRRLTPWDHARALSAIPRARQRDRMKETTDAMREALGLPEWAWRD